jgi:hypothetical protein
MSAKSIGNRFPLPGCRGISGRGSCRPAELTSPAILHSRSDAQFRGEIRLGLLCAGSSSAKIGRSVGSREKTHMARVGTASPLRRDRGFESPFLQQRVSLSPASAFEGREIRLSARVCAAAWRPGRQRRARCFDIAPTSGNISVGPYSSTAVPLMWSVENAKPVPAKSGPSGGLGCGRSLNSDRAQPKPSRVR